MVGFSGITQIFWTPFHMQDQGWTKPGAAPALITEIPRNVRVPLVKAKIQWATFSRKQEAKRTEVCKGGKCKEALKI